MPLNSTNQPTKQFHMKNLDSVLENERLKFVWDFEIQMDHLISTRRLDLVTVNKKRELAE